MTDEQLSEDLMKSMYGQTGKKAKAKTVQETINISKSSKDSYLIEHNNEKIQVPSMEAHQQLIAECKQLRTDLSRQYQSNKQLAASVKSMIKAVNEMDEELKGKIDKHDPE